MFSLISVHLFLTFMRVTCIRGQFSRDFVLLYLPYDFFISEIFS